MNRGIARRPLFETRADIRKFLASVARAVRRGQIEVHAWCVLSTHFHMLVRSPRGELSAAMRRVQNEYVRYFNRTRRRDGPLVRGRFRSKLVDTLSYRQLLVRYIDSNPVQAGLCSDPRLYPWGSARQYGERRGPPWLSRDWIEGLVVEQSGARRYDPCDYPGASNARSDSALAEFVVSRLASPHARDDLDSLLGMSSPAARAWLARKAELADGVTGQPLVAATSISKLIAAWAAARGCWEVRPHGRTNDAWRVLHAGLLRSLAGASFRVIAHTVGGSDDTASRLAERHRQLLSADERYRRVAAAAVRELVAQTFAMRFAGNGAERK